MYKKHTNWSFYENYEDLPPSPTWKIRAHIPPVPNPDTFIPIATHCKQEIFITSHTHTGSCDCHMTNFVCIHYYVYVVHHKFRTVWGRGTVLGGEVATCFLWHNYGQKREGKELPLSEKGSCAKNFKGPIKMLFFFNSPGSGVERED